MTLRRWLSVPIVLCCTAALFACARGLETLLTQAPPMYHDGSAIVEDRGTSDQQGRAVLVECPNVRPHPFGRDQSELSSYAVHDTAVSAPLAGETIDMPEYHDCQRLVPPGGPGDFGPLVGIFAREALGALPPDSFSSPSGVAVAQLYNFSSFPYGPLGIRPEYSCLYLRLANGDWSAKLVHHDKDRNCRGLTAQDWQSRGPLQVNRLTPSSNPADYPPAARWDWSPRTHQHFMGVPCLAGWCEVGLAFGSPAYGGPVTQRIKGWYDEQRLAHPGSGPSPLRPGVPGRIVPVARLDTLQTVHFTCVFPCGRQAGWVHVATVFLDTTSLHYKRKLNFDAGSAGNRIYLRRMQNNSLNLERWQGRIVSARGDTTYHHTLRVDHDHPGVPEPPATARWHWRENDETTWVRCTLGCCELNGTRITDPDVW